MKVRPLLPALALLGAAPPPPAPSDGRLVLRSVTLALPDEPAAPDGDADAQLVAGNCTGCHSLSMISTQPKLDAAHWQAEVDKMRSAYKAPVDEADGRRIAAILAARQGALGR